MRWIPLLVRGRYSPLYGAATNLRAAAHGVNAPKVLLRRAGGDGRPPTPGGGGVQAPVPFPAPASLRALSPGSSGGATRRGREVGRGALGGPLLGGQLRSQHLTPVEPQGGPVRPLGEVSGERLVEEAEEAALELDGQ